MILPTLRFSSFLATAPQPSRPEVFPAPQFAGRSKDPMTRLFPKGLENIQLTQGVGVSDCQLLSLLFSMSRNAKGRQVLTDMIQVLPNGDFKVTFKPHPDYPILVTAREARQKPPQRGERKRPHVQADLGVRVLEIAYAKLMKLKSPSAFWDVPDTNILSLYNHKNYHHNMIKVLNDVTGWRAEIVETKDPQALKQSLERVAAHPERYLLAVSTNTASGKFLDRVTRVRNAFAEIATPQEQDKLSRVIQKLFTEEQLKDRDYPVDLGGKIPSWHLQALEAYDPERQELRIRDPHETKVALGLSFEDFLTMYRAVIVAQVPFDEEA